jgi:dTDP-4-amino-4,6-dideoxygalactose transaminase
MNKRIYLSPPHMGGEELKFIQEAFDTNWISPVGPHIERFEAALCQYNGVEYCAAVSSGTAAIHLALIILGVKSGDEVLCSSFTFAGSCNPIVYTGATPVFIDSEADTWNMDPQLLEEAIRDRIRLGKHPKAIIVVHLYGMPAKMLEIQVIARKYEIPVIEDAAEALGSTIQGKKAGTFGDFGVYSFNGNKIITTSGGGALVSANKDWIERAKFLATQARENAPHYQHEVIGYNYRLSNICACIGLGQLQVLGKRVGQRRKVFDYYVKELAGVGGIRFLSELSGNFSNRWLSTILVDNERFTRETIRIALENSSIDARPLWKPMHLQPVFKGSPAYTNGVSDRLFENGLCLPSGSDLSKDDLRRILEVILGAAH